MKSTIAIMIALLLLSYIYPTLAHFLMVPVILFLVFMAWGVTMVEEQRKHEKP